jgi:hypothetical protein
VILIHKDYESSFIIDGLDECDRDIAEPDDMIDALVSVPDSGILFLSRKEEHLQCRLDDWHKTEIGRDRTTQNDIRNFVSDQVSELLFHIKAAHLQRTEEEIMKFLLDAARNMFLYVWLVVQNLIKNKGSSSEDLQNILENSPKGLDNMYQQYFLTLHRKNSKKHNRLAV